MDCYDCFYGDCPICGKEIAARSKSVKLHESLMMVLSKRIDKLSIGDVEKRNAKEKWDEEYDDEIYTDEDNYDFPMIYGEKYSFDELIMNLLEKYCGLQYRKKQKIKIQVKNGEMRIKRIEDE